MPNRCNNLRRNIFSIFWQKHAVVSAILRNFVFLLTNLVFV